MSEGVVCNDYPCDTAFSRGTHKLRDGHVLHMVRSGHESRKDTDGDLVLVWQTAAIAWDDRPWRPHIHVENGQRTFEDPNEASRLAGDLQTAITWAMEANLKEAQAEAEALRLDLDDLVSQS